MSNKFIVRVYGIYIHEEKGLLVSDEIVHGTYVTKLPGGGMEYGEGTIECIRREMKEETGFDFEVIEHFYTTDFFVESAFHPDHQVLSIYYLIKPSSELNLTIANEVFQFKSKEEGDQSFRYIPMSDLNPDVFTFPIDKVVIGLLRERSD
jgi:8-oxo-dGTP diphosphatase